MKWFTEGNSLKVNLIVIIEGKIIVNKIARRADKEIRFIVFSYFKSL